MNNTVVEHKPISIIFYRAADLPAEWDEKSNGNPYLKRAFLVLMEKVNPCNQKYVLFRDGSNRLNSILVMYDMGVNLLSFLTKMFRFVIKVKFVYVPLSVDAGGIVVGDETRKQVQEYLGREKGLKVVVNPENDLDLPGFAKGLNLPTHKMAIRWPSFKEYLASMRSNHRHSCRAAMKKGAELKIEEIEPDQFNKKMYSLYLQVYAHAEHTLEKLPLEFFQTLPATILKLTSDGKCVGFAQLLNNGEELIFEFCGFDYFSNVEHGTYINILLAIVRYGIEHGHKSINFGQTTEELKMKLGCVQEDRHIFAGHSNRLINWVLNKFAGLLSYKKLDKTFDVFKN